MSETTRYKSPTKRMRHQESCLRHMRERPRSPSDEDVFAVLADKGTGKTKIILDEFQERVEKDIDLLCVFAPKGSYRNWFEDKNELQQSELKTHLDPRLLRRLKFAAWTGGAESRRRREMLLRATGPRAFFMNIEALSSGKKAESYVSQLVASASGRVMLVIDESTRIRGSKTERTKALLRIKRVASVAGAVSADKRALPARRIMSGLVTPKSPMDLHAQFEFLDWRVLGFESKVAFRARYAVVERQCFVPNDIIRHKLRQRWPAGASSIERMSRSMLLEECERRRVWVQHVDVVKGFRNLGEIWEKLRPYSFRVLKEDCLDLKPKIYMTREVELTEEQRTAYREIQEYATTQVGDGHVVANAVIQQMIRLQQITCGHVRDENNVLRHVKSRRIETLMEILEEHSGKAIVWCAWRPEIEKIAAALREHKEFGPGSFAEFHGGNSDTRGEDERRFLTDPECRVMISTQSAGGLGNTWNVADLTVYYANDYNLEHRDQSEDRNHRKGQEKSVTYVDLVARGTTDEKIILALRNKINLASTITGETMREWLI